MSLSLMLRTVVYVVSLHISPRREESSSKTIITSTSKTRSLYLTLFPQRTADG